MPWIVTEYIKARDMLEQEKDTPKQNHKQQDKNAYNFLFQT